MKGHTRGLAVPRRHSSTCTTSTESCPQQAHSLGRRGGATQAISQSERSPEPAEEDKVNPNPEGPPPQELADTVARSHSPPEPLGRVSAVPAPTDSQPLEGNRFLLLGRPEGHSQAQEARVQRSLQMDDPLLILQNSNLGLSPTPVPSHSPVPAPSGLPQLLCPLRQGLYLHGL